MTVDLTNMDMTLHCVRSARRRLIAMAAAAESRGTFGLQDVVLADDIEGLDVACDTLTALRTALETAERERDEARADRDAWRAKAEARPDITRDAAREYYSGDRLEYTEACKRVDAALRAHASKAVR